jgi:hypothetical protein
VEGHWLVLQGNRNFFLGMKTLCFHVPSMKYSKSWASEMLGNCVGYFLTHMFTHDSIEAKDNSHTTLVTSLGSLEQFFFFST